MRPEKIAPPGDARPGNGESAKRYKRPKQSALVRFGKSIRDPVNAWFARQSLIGDDMIVDPSQLPVLEELGANWQEISQELEPLLASRTDIPSFGKISPDHRRIANSDKWKSFFFEGYGYRSQANRQKCPRTAELLDKVPGLVVAFFSIMEPNTHVPRHRGLTKAWLNCHLGLVVPRGPERCEMEIGDQRVGWSEGEWVVFDETNAHEVWNDTGEARVVLFLQIRRPMTRRGNFVARTIYEIIRRTSFVKDVRKAVAD